MFDIEFIKELSVGSLSDKGYKSMIRGIASVARNHKWQKAIIAPELIQSNYWTDENIEDLAHYFFEWGFTNGKFNQLKEIPESHLSYYFTQIFKSFVANRISEEQQKKGLSYEKCKKLVFEICAESYFSKEIDGVVYISSYPFEYEDVKREDRGMDSLLDFLPHILIREDAKHFKPLVKNALEEIFSLIDYPVKSSTLIKLIFNLFDQRIFFEYPKKATYQEEIGENNPKKHQRAIENLLAGLSKQDAQIISEYLFQSHEKISLSTLGKKNQMPKRTVHHRIESFKKKILINFIPENQEDGIIFMENLSSALNEQAK